MRSATASVSAVPMDVLSSPSGNNIPLYPENAVLLAPLAGHTDLPMRLSARRHGCRYLTVLFVRDSCALDQNPSVFCILER